MTTAYDAQRSSWVHSDAKISRESMQKPGFELVWKLKFENAPGLTPPALIDFYIGYRGFRTLAFFGAGSDRVIAVDTDLGRIEWEKAFSSGAKPAVDRPCPGGMTSAVTRPTDSGYSVDFVPRGMGRATPAKSGVGLPHQGAVTLQDRPAPPRLPPPAKAKPGAAPAPNPFMARVQWLHVLSADGKFHSLYVSNGEEPNPPVQFLPPNAHALGLIIYDNTAYVATTNGCGGVANGVWALDLASKKVSNWKYSGKGIAGTAGPAARPDGTLYVAGVGGELFALAPRTLEPLGSYRTDGAEFTSSPVVFEFKGKDLIAVASGDGRLHLLDAGALHRGAPLDRSAPYSSPGFATGSLTTWQDPAGTRWILVPAGGAVAKSAGFAASNGEIRDGSLVAWKVVDKGGAPAFEPGWVSRNFVSPLPPIVVNGVIFAVAGGARGGANAVLYALDPATGKEWWSSGTAIASFVQRGGLAAGGTRVYVATQDGTQYAFGFPIEH
jgi:outer membrane protein assembly factor BamB